MATQICGSADLTRLQRVLNILTVTASEMALAEESLRARKLGEPGELQREAAFLRREVACLMRVIDGCAALHRGLGIRLGCSALTDSPESYSPQGRPVVASHADAACEMQG